jgi:DNA-directed RNA polymerase specialized sigma24 family protein
MPVVLPAAMAFPPRVPPGVACGHFLTPIATKLRNLAVIPNNSLAIVCNPVDNGGQNRIDSKRSDAMQTRLDDTTLDMRRKQRRAQIARLLDAADHLPSQERLLLIAIYGRGMAVSEAAAMLGTPERQLRRRVRALVRRVCDPSFDAAVGLRPELPRLLREVARLKAIEGLSLRQVAQRLGVSYHTVRKQYDAFRALIDASSKAPRSNPGSAA